MSKYFTKTFFRFFFGFLAIIALAFGILITTSQFSTPAVDNTAAPK